jgi:hypothetical protein
MRFYGKRWPIALVLLIGFAVTACGPHVPDLTSRPTPAGTAGATGGGGTNAPGPTTGVGTEPSSPSDSEPPGQSTEPTDETETASPTDSDSVTPTPTLTPTPTPTLTPTPTPTPSPTVVEVPTIKCTPDVPASPAIQVTAESFSLAPNESPPDTLDLSLTVPQKCAVGLGKPPETAACLFVWLEFRLAGQGITAVRVGIQSGSLTADAGLHEEKTLEAGPETKLAEVRTNIRTTDLGATHEVTFNADPNNAIEETDEKNNSVTVKLSLPARETLPASAVCPTETTATPQVGGSTSPAPATETAAVGTETAAAGS